MRGNVDQPLSMFPGIKNVCLLLLFLLLCSFVSSVPTERLLLSPVQKSFFWWISTSVLVYHMWTCNFKLFYKPHRHIPHHRCLFMRRNLFKWLMQCTNTWDTAMNVTVIIPGCNYQIVFRIFLCSIFSLHWLRTSALLVCNKCYALGSVFLHWLFSLYVDEDVKTVDWFVLVTRTKFRLSFRSHLKTTKPLCLNIFFLQKAKAN